MIPVTIAKHIYKRRTYMYRKKACLSCLAVFFFCLVSCSMTKTTVTDIWQDDTYQGGTLKNILVIGAAERQVIRKAFEDEMVKGLKDENNKITPSYRVLPFDKMLDEETILAKVKELQIDAVLITRVMSKAYGDLSAPEESKDWHNFYARSYGGYEAGSSSVVYGPKTVRATIQTNLYETKDEKLIWSASQDVTTKTEPEKALRAVIKVILQELDKTGLIK